MKYPWSSIVFLFVLIFCGCDYSKGKGTLKSGQKKVSAILPNDLGSHVAVMQKNTTISSGIPDDIVVHNDTASPPPLSPPPPTPPPPSSSPPCSIRSSDAGLPTNHGIKNVEVRFVEDADSVKLKALRVAVKDLDLVSIEKLLNEQSQAVEGIKPLALSVHAAIDPSFLDRMQSFQHVAISSIGQLFIQLFEATKSPDSAKQKEVITLLDQALLSIEEILDQQPKAIEAPVPPPLTEKEVSRDFESEECQVQVARLDVEQKIPMRVPRDKEIHSPPSKQDLFNAIKQGISLLTRAERDKQLASKVPKKSSSIESNRNGLKQPTNLTEVLKARMDERYAQMNPDSDDAQMNPDSDDDDWDDA